MTEDKGTHESWGRKIRAIFMAGLLVVVPVGATVLLLVWIFNSIDNILQPVVRAVVGRSLPGVGFGATIIIIFLSGILARNYIGKQIIRYGDSLIARVPVFRGLYTSIRQIVASFVTPDKSSFLQVVLVEFPRPEVWTIGFLTNEMTLDNGEKIYNVLIPTSPTPWSGFVQVFLEKDIIRTDISVEDAVKMIVSAGRVTSENIQRHFKAPEMKKPRS